MKTSFSLPAFTIRFEVWVLECFQGLVRNFEKRECFMSITQNSQFWTILLVLMRFETYGTMDLQICIGNKAYWTEKEVRFLASMYTLPIALLSIRQKGLRIGVLETSVEPAALLLKMLFWGPSELSLIHISEPTRPY